MTRNEFLRHFKSELYISEMKSNTKEGVLEEMVEHIANRTPLKDRKLISDMLKRREQLGSTGIGHGIAIPHGRSIAVPELLVAFGRSTPGIPFDSIDKKPVHLVFMIIAPPQEQSNIYLPFLGKLVDLLKHEKLRENLLQAKTYREFYDTLAGGF